MVDVGYVSLPQPVADAIEFVLQLLIGPVDVAVVVVARELLVGLLLLLGTELVAIAAMIPEQNAPGLVAKAGLELRAVERAHVIRRFVLEQWRRGAGTTSKISWSRQMT